MNKKPKSHAKANKKVVDQCAAELTAHLDDGGHPTTKPLPASRHPAFWGVFQAAYARLSQAASMAHEEAQIHCSRCHVYECECCGTRFDPQACAEEAHAEATAVVDWIQQQETTRKP